MKLKTQSFLIVLLLLLIACNKEAQDENSEIDIPTVTVIDVYNPNGGGVLSNTPDGQFISFKADESTIIWIDNATQASTNGTSIESSMGTIIPDDNPEDVYFNFVVNITKATQVILSDPIFESINFSFHQKWAVEETTTNIDGCQMLPEGEFGNLFMSGDWNPLGRICLDEIENKGVSMGISARINKEPRAGTSANSSNCEEAPFDQTDSFFRITSFEKIENDQNKNRLQIDLSLIHI